MSCHRCNLGSRITAIWYLFLLLLGLYGANKLHAVITPIFQHLQQVSSIQGE